MPFSYQYGVRFFPTAGIVKRSRAAWKATRWRWQRDCCKQDSAWSAKC